MKTNKKRLLLLVMAVTLIVGAVGGCTPRSGEEGEFPSKPIQVIVYHGAGGGTDRVVRALAGNWSTYSDAPMRIVNMPGGGSTDGAIYVRDANPDGYTLMAITSFMIPTPVSRPELNIELENYRPIFNISTAPQMIVVHKDSPFTTLGQLVDYAKANPGQLTYGCSGAGGDLHIGTEVFADRAGGLQFTHVPLGGGAEQLAMLLGGHIDFAFGTFGSHLPSVKAGESRALAVVDAQRHPDLPDVPTTLESGVDFLFPTFRGIAAPVGLPDDRAAILEDIGRQVMEDPGMAPMLRQFGEVPEFIGGQDYKDYMYSIRADVVPVMQRLGLA